jgi:hypothetical protein
MTDDDIKELDALFRLPRITRMLLPEDHPDARWDPFNGIFVESNEALRKRMKSMNAFSAWKLWDEQLQMEALLEDECEYYWENRWGYRPPPVFSFISVNTRGPW